jgi:hypothetical protein
MTVLVTGATGRWAGSWWAIYVHPPVMHQMEHRQVRAQRRALCSIDPLTPG